MEYYYNADGTQIGVLVSYGFGAGWSTWGDRNLAVDKRIIEYWFAHKDNPQWRKDINSFCDNPAITDMHNFLNSIGYGGNTYLGGVNDLKLEWVDCNRFWRINEYDGNEMIEFLNLGTEWFNIPERK